MSDVTTHSVTMKARCDMVSVDLLVCLFFVYNTTQNSTLSTRFVNPKQHTKQILFLFSV